MKILRRPLLERFSALSLLILFLLLIPANPTHALSVNPLGDYDNITVMEVVGDYAAINENGQANLSPRQEISRQFYSAHNDDYDFLVVFTNFDFLMPATGTRAFFHPTKNDVEGIGLDLFDATHLYSADGAFLNRLEGMIDMANIDGHELHPTSADFEKSLQALTHEMMHRWGAYLSFSDDNQESQALLGLGNAHWSFLLDSQGSSLYGNHWQGNGDGTYTSVAPEQSNLGSYLGRVFSPLELYLMGLYDQQQVPPLTLIDSPGIDRNRLPEVGVTIPGSIKTITIEQIISAMGERFPAEDPDRAFRMGFVFLVNPGTWSAEDPESMRQIQLIRNLQLEWQKRFSLLTDGAAIMQTDLVTEDEPDSNPGVELDLATYHVSPHINDGINWLLANQNENGSWQDQNGTAQRDTAIAVTALKPFITGAAAVSNGQTWLGNSTPANSDFLARKLLGLSSASLSDIESLQNLDGGWGSAPGYRSNPVDSALALKALATHASTSTSTIDAAINYLRAVQGADGGWNSGLGASMVQATACALLALTDYRDNLSYILEPSIIAGMTWLTGKQNGDGGFGNSLSTVYDTAMAVSALKAVGASQISTDSAITYLLSRQGSTGSWHRSAFQTAMAVQALYAGTIQTDLQVEAVDLSVTPFPVVSMPADITLTAQIWNHGEAMVPTARVVLYQGDPALGAIEGQVEISIAGHSFTNVDFPVHLAASGDVEYFVLVDPDDLVEEVNDNNNLASIAFVAGLQPTVSFELASSSGPESTTGAVGVSLSHSWDQSISVDLEIDSSSTATAVADYNVTPGSLVFNPGETFKTVAVNIVNDAIPEGDETLVLALSGPVNATLSQDRTTYTIVNDDVPPVVGFALSNMSGSEEVGAVSIAVELSHAYPLDVAVDYAIDDAASGATPGADLLFTAGTLLIPAGETTATIGMTIVNDTLEESDEVLVIRLANSREALVGIDTLTYTILDNDAAPQVTITSPVDNASYTSEQVLLQYQTNMPAGQVAVYLNDVAIATRDGQPLLQGNGSYSVRVVVSNANNLSTEDVVTFEIDDTGEPPVFVWQDFLDAGTTGGHYYDCLQYSDDGAVYAVRPSPAIVKKFDQNGYVHWSQPLPVEDYSSNYCKDSTMTEDAFVVLDATSIRWFSDVSNASGVLSHSVDLPVYADSSPWSKFTMDSSANYYLVGSTREGIARNDSVDGGNVQLAKMDVANHVLWRQVIATNLTDIVTDVTTDSSGNVYLLGTTGGYLGQSGGSNAGETDVFLIKIDSDGNQLWSRQWGTSLAENSGQLAVDSQGNVVLLGDTFGTFDGSGPTYDQDAFVVKVAPDGTELWLSQDHGISGGQVLTLSKEDDVVIAGWFGRKRSGFFVNLNVKWSRYSADGGHIWTSAVNTGSLSYDETVRGLTIDPSGNSFISASYNFENYSTMKWEYRGFLSKYTVGTDLSPPLLTVKPYEYDPVNKLLALSGKHEYMANLSVQVDTSAVVSTVTSKYSTAWSSTISDLSPGQHRITIQASDGDGVVSQKDIVLDVVAPSPFTSGVTDQYGTSNQDVPLASVISNQDQLYVVGYEGTSDGSDQDVTIWQANISGGMLPFAKIDMAEQERGKAVSVDSNGFVYMAWVSGGNSYVGKFDSVGTQLWTSDYSSRKGIQNVEGMTVDALGNVFIAGQTDASPDRNVAHGGGQDYFLVKFNSNGAYQWSRLSGPGHPGDQGAYGLDVDSTGNLYLAGFSQGSIHGEPAANSAFIAKFDNDGNLQWADVIEASRPGAIQDLIVDQFDNAYVLGEVDYLTGRGKDVFLAKYAPAGVLSWFETFGGDYDDYARDIALDKNGNVLMTCLMNRSPYLNVFKRDILWAKYDASAHLLWVERFDADTSGDSTGIHETSQGNIIIAGRTNLTLGETNYGLSDLFLREFRLVSGPVLTVDPVMTPTASQAVLLSGQVSPGAAVSVTAAAPTSSTATVGAVTLNPVTGFWSCQITTLMPNIDNVLTVLASDSYGSSRQSVTITVDTLPPRLDIDNVPSTTGLPTLYLSGSVEGGATLTVAVNPSGSQAVLAETEGLWSYTADLVEGDNDLIFTATDAVGNVVMDTITITRLPPPPTSINVRPETIQQGEQAEVTLTINNPDGIGSSVYVAMLYDVTGDGFSADDVSVRKFHLYDGVSSDDPNVPGDEDGLMDGRLTTTLNFQYIYDMQRAPGNYIFKVSLDSQPYVAPFTILETSQAQTLQGYVSDGQNAPIVGARVQLYDKWGHNYGYAYTDVAGHYVVNVAEPGQYYLIPTSRDHAYDKANIVVETLGSGQSLGVDLSMVSGSTTISGWLKNSSTSEIITGGNYVRAENEQYLAEAYDLAHISATDDVFKYEIAVPAGDYDLYLDSFNSRGAFAQGYLGIEGFAAQTLAEPQELWLDQATGLVCGKVLDQSMMRAAGVVLVARSDDGTGQFATAVTDVNGDYCIGLSSSGSWRISLNDKANQAVGYVGNYVDGITAIAGPFNGNDLSVAMIEAWVSGTVLADGLGPVAGVPVELTNETTGFMVRGETALDGTYRLGALAGEWRLMVSPQDLGLPSVNPVAVALASGQTVSQDVNISPQSEPAFVDVVVQSPTDQSSQTIGGNRSENATVTVTVDTDASVGAVVSLSSTTWECTIVNLTEGTNTVSVSASNGVDSYQASDVYLDYQPAQPANTIAITGALYTSRKKTLTVAATSDYVEAALMVEYAGIAATMNFEKLFKGKYQWSYTDTNVAMVPAAITVSGPEGSTTEPVAYK